MTSRDQIRRILGRHQSDMDPLAFYSEWKALHKRNMRCEAFSPERELFGHELAELYAIHAIQGDPIEDVRVMLDSLYNRVAYNDIFYTSILDACGWLPEDVLFVGDSPEEDVIVPSRLGMQTVFVDRNKSGVVHGQNHTVDNLISLCGIL